MNIQNEDKTAGTGAGGCVKQKASNDWMRGMMLVIGAVIVLTAALAEPFGVGPGGLQVALGIGLEVFALIAALCLGIGTADKGESDSRQPAWSFRRVGILVVVFSVTVAGLFLLIGGIWGSQQRSLDEMKELKRPIEVQGAALSDDFEAVPKKMDAPKVDAPDRFYEESRQCFSNGGVLIVWRDSETGAAYLMCRNGAGGGMSICPMSGSATGEKAVKAAVEDPAIKQLRNISPHGR